MGKRGPKPWDPTDDQRRLIEHYAAIGYTQEQIASLLDVSVDTLQRRARRELDLGALTVNGKIGGKLYQKAMSGDTSALIFWAKTRMGWSETQKHEHTGKDGRPIEYRDLSEDEIDARLRDLMTRHGTDESSKLAH